MKSRILSIILAIVFLLSLAACGNTFGTAEPVKSGEGSAQAAGSSTAVTEGTARPSDSTAKSADLKTVKLGFPGTQNVMSGIAGVAQANGYFDEELAKNGYKVEYVPFAAAGPAVNEALAGKKIDLAIYADFPGLVLKSKGVGISIIAIDSNYTTSTILVKKDSPIQSVKDLKGKKVAFTKGTFMQKNFLELLAQNGLEEKDVQVVNVITTDAASALLTGNVDALIYVDTSIASILADGSAREIDSTRNHADIRAQSIFVGVDSYVNENPVVPVAIIKALLKAKEYVKTNPQESLQIWTKSGLSEDALKIIYGTDSSKYESYFPVEISQDAIDKLTVTKDFLLKQGLISDDYDIQKFVNGSYYEKAIQ